MPGFRTHILIITLLLAMIGFLQYRLWLGPDGLNEMAKLKQVLLNQTDENTKLKQRNDELLFQIKRLQNSHDEAEARARNELGMIKKGETFYQIVK